MSATTSSNVSTASAALARLPPQQPLPHYCIDEIDTAMPAASRPRDFAAADHWSQSFRAACMAPRWSPELEALRRLRIAEVIQAFTLHCRDTIAVLATRLFDTRDGLRTALPAAVYLTEDRWYADGVVFVHCTSPRTIAAHVVCSSGPKVSEGRKLALAQLRAAQAMLSVHDEAPFTLVPPLTCVVAHLGCTFACTAVLDAPSTSFVPVAEVRDPVAFTASSMTRQCLSLASSREDIATHPYGATVAVMGGDTRTPAVHRCAIAKGWDLMFPPHSATFQPVPDAHTLRQRTEGTRREGSATLAAARCFDRSLKFNERSAADREANKLSRKTPAAAVAALVAYLCRPTTGCAALGGGRIIELLHDFSVNVRFIGGIVTSMRRAVQTLRQHAVAKRSDRGRKYLEQHMASVQNSARRSSSARRPTLSSVRGLPMGDAEDAMEEPPARMDNLTIEAMSWQGPAICLEFLCEETAARAIRDEIWSAMRTAATGITSHAPAWSGANASRVQLERPGTASSKNWSVEDAVPKFGVDCSSFSRASGSEVQRACELAAEAMLLPLFDAAYQGDEISDRFEAYWAERVLPRIQATFTDFTNDGERVVISVSEVNPERLIGRVLDLTGLTVAFNDNDDQWHVSAVPRVKSLDPYQRRTPLHAPELKRLWETGRRVLSELPGTAPLPWTGVAMAGATLQYAHSDWAPRMAPVVEDTLDALPPYTKRRRAEGRAHSATKHASATPVAPAAMRLCSLPTRAELLQALNATSVSPAIARAEVMHVQRCCAEMQRFAVLLLMGGKRERGVQLQQSVRDGLHDLYRSITNPDPSILVLLAESESVLAEAMMLQTQLDAARDTAVRMVRVCEEPPGKALRSFLVWASRCAARVESFSDGPMHLSTARARLQLAFETIACIVGPWHEATTDVVHDIGRLLLRLEQEGAARQVFHGLRRLASATDGPFSAAMRRALLALAMSSVQLEQFDKALADIRRVQACAPSVFELPDASVAAAALVEARIRIATAEYGKARQVLTDVTKTAPSEELVSDAKLDCLRLLAHLMLATPTVLLSVSAKTIHGAHAITEEDRSPEELQAAAADAKAKVAAAAATAVQAMGESAAGDDDQDELRDPDYNGAFSTLSVVLAAVERRFGPRSMEAADSVAAMADIFSREDRLMEALHLYKVAEGIAEAVLGQQHPIVALHRVREARCAAAMGDPVKAAAGFREALGFFKATGEFQRARREYNSGQQRTGIRTRSPSHRRANARRGRSDRQANGRSCGDRSTRRSPRRRFRAAPLRAAARRDGRAVLDGRDGKRRRRQGEEDGTDDGPAGQPRGAGGGRSFEDVWRNAADAVRVGAGVLRCGI
jgi:hypothetical protein